MWQVEALPLFAGGWGGWSQFQLTDLVFKPSHLLSFLRLPFSFVPFLLSVSSLPYPHSLSFIFPRSFLLLPRPSLVLPALPFPRPSLVLKSSLRYSPKPFSLRLPFPSLLLPPSLYNLLFTLPVPFTLSPSLLPLQLPFLPSSSSFPLVSSLFLLAPSPSPSLFLLSYIFTFLLPFHWSFFLPFLSAPPPPPPSATYPNYILYVPSLGQLLVYFHSL